MSIENVSTGGPSEQFRGTDPKIDDRDLSLEPTGRGAAEGLLGPLMTQGSGGTHVGPGSSAHTVRIVQNDPHVEIVSDGRGRLLEPVGPSSFLPAHSLRPSEKPIAELVEGLKSTVPELSGFGDYGAYLVPAKGSPTIWGERVPEAAYHRMKAVESLAANNMLPAASSKGTVFVVSAFVDLSVVNFLLERYPGAQSIHYVSTAGFGKSGVEMSGGLGAYEGLYRSLMNDLVISGETCATLQERNSSRWSEQPNLIVAQQGTSSEAWQQATKEISREWLAQHDFKRMVVLSANAVGEYSLGFGVRDNWLRSTALDVKVYGTTPRDDSQWREF